MRAELKRLAVRDASQAQEIQELRDRVEALEEEA
jgi:hypothetical protein